MKPMHKLAGPAIAIGLAVACAAAPTSALNAATSSMQDNAILLSVGGSRVINLPAKMSDVVIADPEVVDVHVRSQNQLYLIAKKAGETTVFATAPNGKVLFSGTVRVGNNITSIDDMLRIDAYRRFLTADAPLNPAELSPQDQRLLLDPWCCCI